jgi:hypothetical protein
MSTPADLPQLLGTLEPELQEGVYAFACLPQGTDTAGLDPIATLREREGLTVVVTEAVANEHQLTVLFRAAWITLRVHSDLQAVGLTAAFAGALARAGLSCNVLAGACHDHLFVPAVRADEAMAVLRALQREAQASKSGGA